MFWSYKTLESNLPNLIFDESGQPCGKKENIDCNAYTLTIGPEVFITPSDPRPKKEKGHTKSVLTKTEQFVIPKGQFAFLTTEEIIFVPEEAMAFISFKATFKFRGLINVSGFHVDPGYKGRLLFSLFNAGPKDVTLQRGDKFALIWYAGLDTKQQPKEGKKDSTVVQNLGISSKLVGPMNDEVFSPAVVQQRITNLSDRVKDVEVKMKLAVLGLLIAILLGLIIDIFKDRIEMFFLPKVEPTPVVGPSVAISRPSPDEGGKPLAVLPSSVAK